MIINHDFGAGRSKSPPLGAQLGLVLFVGLEKDSPDIDLSKHLHALSVSSRTFMSLERATFDCLAPRLVMTPLLSGNLDVLDFAQKLQTLDFNGRYRAVVRKLPDATMISREVENVAPEVDFAVTEIYCDAAFPTPS
ncbi:MAG: hypothetical protein GXP03_03895 [Alphaproteobacteria bacterium]|nr:hypothetical protein [Alphaproteobacteria bacterium]